MNMLTIFMLDDLARRQIAQTKMMQETTSEKDEMTSVILAFFVSSFIVKAQTIADMATFSRHTMALAWLRRKFRRSSG